MLTAARGQGPISRDKLADTTRLSLATVNRQVSRLLAVGLLDERPDLARSGAVGRPRVPVEVDTHNYMALGIHIGVHRATLAASDLRGRILGAVEIPTPRGEPEVGITALAHHLERFGEQWPQRTPVHTGLVVGGQLSSDRQRLRHPRLGWDSTPIADIAGRATRSQVAVVPQVEAMAAAETLLARRPIEGTTLYVYAREGVGAALRLDGATESPWTAPGTISHLPVGGDQECHCGAIGCLEASAGDAAVAETARRRGIVPTGSITTVIDAAQAGSRAAHDLLAQRGRLLGRGVALLRDVLNPDHVILGGQAFTGYRPALAHVSRSFAETTSLEPMSLEVTGFGHGIQALAACTAALRPLYADPLWVIRKATGQSTPRGS